MTGGAHHEHVAQALIEDDLGGHPAVGAAEHHRGRLLLFGKGGPMLDALAWMFRPARNEAQPDLIRPGIFLYGGEARPQGPAPRPVAALRARVAAVRRVAPGESVSYGATWTADRPTTIATLAIGYADGLPRATDRGTATPPRSIELRGRAVPLVGRVTMDMCMAAVDDGQVAVGDIATIFGGLVTLDQQASSAGTIAYELLTSLGPRLPRRYR